MAFRGDKYIWKDRKRFWGMPLSFTRYAMSEDRLFLSVGCLSIRDEEILLYRVRDISSRRGLWQRLCARLKKPQPPEVLPTVYLSDVFVAPQCRGGGRGAALVRAALQRLALPEDTRQIAVYCAPEMMPFYEKLQLRTGGCLRRWTLKQDPGEETLTRKK